MKRRIGILTSGGDCPGLNAAIRGVAKAAYNLFDAEIIGIENGYQGLIYGHAQTMEPEDFSNLLTLGGTILGTSRQPFKSIRKVGEDKFDKVAAMKRNYAGLKLDCLVVLGGNGTHKTANLLREEGLNVIGLPKTIDNDLFGTDVTFGFHTAVDIATDVIDRIHSTAMSHSRAMVIELMGHKAGWLTLYAGIAGGADIILLPELPYDIDLVAQAVQGRRTKGRKCSIVAVAEGALSAEEARMDKKAFKQARQAMREPSIAYRIAREIEERTGVESRVVVPGHYQRGGSPSAYDRVLSTRLGVFAGQLIAEQHYGVTVAIRGDSLVANPLEDVAGKLKTVPADHELIHAARHVGVSFGAEKK